MLIEIRLNRELGTLRTGTVAVGRPHNLIEKRRPIWEKGVARDLATRYHTTAILPKIFPSVGRSGRDDSKGGVACWKQCRRKFFSGSRGDLMTTEDSRDEGVAGTL